MSTRRLKILRISSELFIGLLSQDGSRLIRIDGMPKDAKVVGSSAHYYLDTDDIALKIESAEFPEVELGHPIPTLELECRVL